MDANPETSNSGCVDDASASPPSDVTASWVWASHSRALLLAHNLIELSSS